MAKMAAVTFLAFVAVLAVAQAGEVPTLEMCEISAANMDATEFVAQAIGGRAGCVDAEDKTQCCDQIRGLFGEGGPAEFCMCNDDFLSAMLMGLPGNHGITPSNYADMLEECDVPVAGKTTCPGVEVDSEVEPKVQGQIIKALILKKVLKKAKLAALAKKAGGRNRGGGGASPVGVGGAAAGAAIVGPPPMVEPMPAAGGKKGGHIKVAPPPAKKVVHVAPPPAKKVVAPPPSKKGGEIVVVEEAPVEPAPAPVEPAPKVTAPAVAPKVTAGRK